MTDSKQAIYNTFIFFYNNRLSFLLIKDMIKKYLHFFLFFLTKNKVFGQKSSIMRAPIRIKCEFFKKWSLPDGYWGYWGELVQKRLDFVLIGIKSCNFSWTLPTLYASRLLNISTLMASIAKNFSKKKKLSSNTKKLGKLVKT